jgi:predicted amidohydrolase YtcJ
MHTTTASWVGFEEDEKGTLEVGKLADIAVLAEDPFASPPEKIRELKVSMTLVGGEVKYQA